ncbi:MAG: hypothetical protein ACM3KE_03590 [Hyphomicrobiales bacterium]
MSGAETRLVGVGCFAQQGTLSRVLGRLMEAYSLGEWKDAVREEEPGPQGCLSLRSLLSGSLDAAEPDRDGPAGEKITGFFLAFENRRLSLAVFTRRQGVRCRTYTTSLGNLSPLRRSRLN